MDAFWKVKSNDDFNDMMFLLVLLIQLCLILVIWFVRTKNNVFRGLEGHFWGLAMLGISRF